jgi:hypothetical protein
MEQLTTLGSFGLLLGSGWSAGINLYLTAAGLGIAHRLHWINLPGELDVLSHWAVIAVAVILYAIEFFADKFPYVDSAWDSVHTIIRPAGGMMIGYLAMSDANPAYQFAIALLIGSIALDSHLTKATTRVVINTSPEPVSNSIASVTEDAGVLGVLYLIINYPIIASLLVILFVVFSFWFLKKMFRFLKSVFTKIKPSETPN